MVRRLRGDVSTMSLGVPEVTSAPWWQGRIGPDECAGAVEDVAGCRCCRWTDCLRNALCRHWAHEGSIAVVCSVLCAAVRAASTYAPRSRRDVAWSHLAPVRTRARAGGGAGEPWMIPVTELITLDILPDPSILPETALSQGRAQA